MKTQQAQYPVIGRVVKLLQAGKCNQKNEIQKPSSSSMNGRNYPLTLMAFYEAEMGCIISWLYQRNFITWCSKNSMKKWATFEQSELCTWPGNSSTDPTCRDIEYFIGNKCQCVKQKRRTLPTRDPLKPILTTAPFEMVSIDFLHLERSSGGYEYNFVIIDHFTRYCQAYATKTSLQKLLLRNYIMILSLDLAFHPKYIMTRVQSLKRSCFTNWNSSVASSTQEPRPIIQRGMANLRDLIEPF